MAASFVAASSQYLSLTSYPVTTMPITMACWARLAAVGAVDRSFITLTDTSSASNLMSVGMRSNEIPSLFFGAGAGIITTQIGSTAMTPGSWVFTIGRYISATSKRGAALFSTGVISHTSETTNATPTPSKALIGARETSGGVGNYWDGDLAEFWIANADIQPDGAQLQNSLLLQLAYGGPFSVPHIAKDIIEYRSFRKHPVASEIGEVYWGKYGVQNWTNNNGVTTGPHVPLSAWYNRPPQTQIIHPTQALLRSGIWSQAAPAPEVTMFDGFYPSMVDRSIKIIPY